MQSVIRWRRSKRWKEFGDPEIGPEVLLIFNIVMIDRRVLGQHLVKGLQGRIVIRAQQACENYFVSISCKSITGRGTGIEMHGLEMLVLFWSSDSLIAPG